MGQLALKEWRVADVVMLVSSDDTTRGKLALTLLRISVHLQDLFFITNQIGNKL